MIKKLLKKYLINLLLLDEEVQKIVKQIALTSIQRKKK